jgi:hypothetical protein
MSIDTPVAGVLPKLAGVLKRLLYEAAVWVPIAALLWYLPQADLVDRAFFVAYVVFAAGFRVWRSTELRHWPWLVLHGAICCVLLSELDKLQGYHSDLALDFALFAAQGFLWIGALALLVSGLRQREHWRAGVCAALVLVGALLSGPMQFARQLWYQSVDGSKPCVYATKITPDTIYGIAYEPRSKVVWFSREEGAQADDNSIDVFGLGGGSMSPQAANVNTLVLKMSQSLFCKT